MSDEPPNTSGEPQDETQDESATSAADTSTEDTPITVSQPETRPFVPNINLVTAALAMLGHKGTDIVSGQTGVVASISFDLYGCVHCALTPPAVEKDAYTRHYDVQRIKLSDEPPVMAAPDFFARAIAPEQHAHGGIDHDAVKRDDILPAR